METKHEKFLYEAVVEAKKAFQKDEVPVGAVVVYRDEIISRAHNLVESLQDATAHAEKLALAKACKKLKSKYLIACTLYTSLEPCSMCAACSSFLQIPFIFFSAVDLKRGANLWKPTLIHPKAIMHQSGSSEESQALLQIFFQKKRAVKKLEKRKKDCFL